MSIEEKEEEIIIAKQATRFGWKDFILNLLFSLIMISSFVVFVIWDSPASDDITDWLLRIAVTILPLFIFVNRTIKEFFYIRIKNKCIKLVNENVFVIRKVLIEIFC